MRARRTRGEYTAAVPRVLWSKTQKDLLFRICMRTCRRKAEYIALPQVLWSSDSEIYQWMPAKQQSTRGTLLGEKCMSAHGAEPQLWCPQLKKRTCLWHYLVQIRSLLWCLRLRHSALASYFSDCMRDSCFSMRTWHVDGWIRWSSWTCTWLDVLKTACVCCLSVHILKKTSTQGMMWCSDVV